MGISNFFDKNKAPSGLDAVRTTFKAVASSFVEERTQRYPDHGPLFHQALATLAVVHDAIEKSLPWMVECTKQTSMRESLKQVGVMDFQPVMKSLTISPVKRLQMFFCINQLQVINSNMDPDGRNGDRHSGWTALLMEGACDLYAESTDVLDKVSNLFDTALLAEGLRGSDPQVVWNRCARYILDKELDTEELLSDSLSGTMLHQQIMASVNLSMKHFGSDSMLTNWGDQLIQRM